MGPRLGRSAPAATPGRAAPLPRLDRVAPLRSRAWTGSRRSAPAPGPGRAAPPSLPVALGWARLGDRPSGSSIDLGEPSRAGVGVVARGSVRAGGRV